MEIASSGEALLAMTYNKMSIRSLDLLDLPLIARYRNDVLTLDSARTLTRGQPLGAADLLAYVNPARHIYAAVSNGDKVPTMLGGITHVTGETFAKLLYLAPLSKLDHTEIPALVENLAMEAGAWGAFHVLAEVDETSDAFIPLRNSGFSVYAWQRMWDVSSLTAADSKSDWERMKSVDLPAVQSLYYQIVPPLLHPIESQPQKASGWISNEAEKCYVGVNSGMYGIVLTPLIHPEASAVSAKLCALIANLPNRGGRPVYLCVRSYQAWLEPVLADLGASAAARQAVMVK
ncbi:MAG TPA: hypothetical protein VHM28_05515, partial [Anaerolineales bacterium]|nr:hypothetical protein [Anaerolineales bacterium]